MRALTRAACAVSFLMMGACAGAPPARTPASLTASDSLGTVWGDEYEDQYVEAVETGRAARGISAEWAGGDTRSARAEVFAEGARVRARTSRSGDTGSMSWQGPGVVREIVAGFVTPVVADGALIGDPRTSSDLRAPSTTRAEGLRLEPSSSPWAASRGAAVVLAPGRFRLGVAACTSPRAESARAGMASIERSAGHFVIGLAGGATRSGAPLHGAGSVFAARIDDDAFVSGEVAVASHQVRTIARAVMGERREWSAIAIAGAGPARDQHFVFTPRERWGAALERRDAWSRLASRTGFSSLTRRDAGDDVQRRRVFWDGIWRLTDGARLEVAARITREESESASGGILAARPVHTTADDWRARVTLRAERATEGGIRVENTYRIELVQNRSGRPASIATWSCQLRATPWEARISATAHALHRGQVAYEPEPAPLSTGEYNSVAGKGASLAASLRVFLGQHAWLSGAWSQKPPGEARLWVGAGFRT